MSGGRSPDGPTRSRILWGVDECVRGPVPLGGELDVPRLGDVGGVDRERRALLEHVDRTRGEIEGDDRVRRRRTASDEGDPMSLHGELGCVPRRRGEGQVEIEELEGAGIEQRVPMLSVPSVGARDPAVGEEAEVRETEHPLRPAELRLHRGEGHRCVRVVAIEVPPAAAIRHEDELVLGAPHRLLGRLARPSRHAARIGRAKVPVHARPPRAPPRPRACAGDPSRSTPAAPHRRSAGGRHRSRAPTPRPTARRIHPAGARRARSRRRPPRDARERTRPAPFPGRSVRPRSGSARRPRG